MRQNNLALEARLTASKQEINQLQENLETVRTESLTDPLTLARPPGNISTRRWSKRSRSVSGTGEPLALLMTDVDHFKRFQRHLRPCDQRPNAAAGGDVGAAERQGQDIAARYGGEREFVVVLPNTVLHRRPRSPITSRSAVMNKGN